MDLLNNLGLNTSMLTEEDIKSLEEACQKIRITPNMDPNKLLSDLRKMGVDIDDIIQRMKIKKEPKHSERFPRNAKCFCGSNKKYKKCCGAVER